jgi:multiple sugar transport system permease protein
MKEQVLPVNAPPKRARAWLVQRNLKEETPLWRGMLTVMTTVGALFMTLPLYWMVRTSLINIEDYYTLPLLWIPSALNWQNFITVFTHTSFAQGYINTIIYAGLVTLNTLFVNVLAAYAFARLRFPGRDFLFLIYLATMMIPDDVKIIPLFVIIKNLHFYDNFGGLVLPLSINPFLIFMLRQFFLSIPRELEEAAFIEGCSELQVLWHIVLPLSRPIVAVITLWSIQGAWENFFWPLVVTQSDTVRTAAVAVVFMGSYALQREPGAVMAALLMLSIPIVLLAMLVQKQIIQGFARSLIIG